MPPPPGSHGCSKGSHWLALICFPQVAFLSGRLTAAKTPISQHPLWKILFSGFLQGTPLSDWFRVEMWTASGSLK